MQMSRYTARTIRLVGVPVVLGTLLTGISPASAAARPIVAASASAKVDSMLFATAATSAKNAWAVGNSGTGTLIKHWNGTTWTRTPSPSIGAQDFLYGVAATSAHNAWAVGTADAQPLIVHWNGTAWATVAMPHLGSGATLAGVTATSTHNAWAVGSSGNKTLLLHWNGAAWTKVRHQNRHGNLLAVTAGSNRNAWAVGNVRGKGQLASARTLTLHWNGKKWKRVASPSPAAHTSLDVMLDGVSIISRRNVWAVGDISCGCGPGTPVIEHWNGKKWKLVHHPKSHTGGNLFGVAGASAHHVWIAGAAGEGTSPEKTLVLTWNGHTWKHERAPSPGGSSDLRGIAVTSARNAWAVGGASNTAQTHTSALIEHWNGTQWRVVRQSTTANAAAHASRRHALWYQTTKGFFLRTAAGDSIPLTNTFSKPVWSSKAHALAYLRFGGHSATATTLSATGKTRDQFTCGCGGVAWEGRSLVGIHKRTLLFRNVGRHTTKRVKLHGAHYKTGKFDTLPTPVASLGRGTLLVTAVTASPSSSGGPEVFFRVTKSGHVTKLAAAPNNTAITGGVTNGHGAFAFVALESAGVCADYGNVSVLDTKSGTLTDVGIPALNRPWVITSLRYSSRALLVGLAKSPKACASTFNSPPTGHATAHLYKRSGNQLVRTSLAVADRRRNAKQVATASGGGTSDSLAGFASHTLTVTGLGHRTVIAHKVFSFGWL
jgi:hypothetical protein